MLLINQKEIKKILPLSDARKSNRITEKAFYDYFSGKAIMPPKQYLNFVKEKGDLRIMPAYSLTLKLAGTKIVNVHPENRKKKMKTVMATIVLNDIKTGTPLCLMDGTYITGLRTGAASAISIKYLARKNAKTVGFMGGGSQVHYQIAAILGIKNFDEIAVCDINPQSIKELKRTLIREKIRVKIKEAGPKEVAQKDILITITPSSVPIVKKEWVRPGTHICAIGADAHGKQELESEILKNAKIVVDEFKQAAHSGEINVPLEKGIIKEKDLYGSLGEIISKKKKGRLGDDEITIFDSTGLAIQDLYLAGFIYNSVVKNKKAQKFEIF